jgi:hypothetical protein
MEDKNRLQVLQFFTPQKQHSPHLYYSKKERETTQTKVRRALNLIQVTEISHASNSLEVKEIKTNYRVLDAGEAMEVLSSSRSRENSRSSSRCVMMGYIQRRV